MIPIDVARALGIGLDAAKFLIAVVPSLIELWNAHDQKSDVVIEAIDAALILKRAANDRALAAKHRADVDIFATRDDEPTGRIP